jgi:hypothetical protein
MDTADSTTTVFLCSTAIFHYYHHKHKPKHMTTVKKQWQYYLGKGTVTCLAPPPTPRKTHTLYTIMFAVLYRVYICIFLTALVKMHSNNWYKNNTHVLYHCCVCIKKYKQKKWFYIKTRYTLSFSPQAENPPAPFTYPPHTTIPSSPTSSSSACMAIWACNEAADGDYHSQKKIDISWLWKRCKQKHTSKKCNGKTVVYLTFIWHLFDR